MKAESNTKLGKADEALNRVLKAACERVMYPKRPDAITVLGASMAPV